MPALASWQPVNPVPDELGEHLDELERWLNLSQSPCSVQAHVVLMDRLFTVVAMPSAEALTIWREALEQFPEDVLGRAVEQVMSHHKYATPPSLGDVVLAAEADRGWAERKLALMRLKTARWKWQRQA
jgi:hypothetical protein